MKYFVSAHQLKEMMVSGTVFIADCRGDLTDKTLGSRSYVQAHIPDSVFVDGEKLLTGPIGEHGGRHPLPDLEKFRKEMEDLGLSDGMNVVSFGFYGARLNFMLNIIGIQDTRLLDGGIDRWKIMGFEMNSVIPRKLRGTITAGFNTNILADMEYVRSRLGKDGFVLLDSRMPERYSGKVEPIDPVAGHIPGAVNLYWESSLDQDKRILPVEELSGRIKKMTDKGKDIVVYCGSGVTAVNNYYILAELGIESKVYSGSWSDWITYPDNPVEKQV